MLTTFLQWNDWGFLLLRLVVGFIFIYHGLPKIRKPEGMAAGLGWAKGTIVVLGLLETLGGLGIALGVFAQLAAVILGVIMIGAIKEKIVRWHTPFFTMSATGWEYDLILLAVCIYILTHGAGAYALGM